MGARVAWRRFAATGVRAGVRPDLLYLLAESLFAYVDALSAESAEGHAFEQSAAAGEAELKRRRLVRLLVRQPSPDRAVVEAAASEAQWPLPRQLAAVALAGGQRDAAMAQLPPESIAEVIGEVLCALIPDPDGPGRRALVDRAVADTGVRAGLGTTVPWREAPLSFARARGALALATGPGELSVARERAGELLLRSDPRLAQELAADRLRPLTALPAGGRTRLTETLSVWLAEQGRLGQVADRLGIHPQTARYRVARLRDLFGSALDDPDERFWLALALRVYAAAGGTGSGSGSGAGAVGTSGPRAPATSSSFQT
jgi:hypothetical protein